MSAGISCVRAKIFEQSGALDVDPPVVQSLLRTFRDDSGFWLDILPCVSFVALQKWIVATLNLTLRCLANIWKMLTKCVKETLHQQKISSF